jgi:uncharacterized protein (DUF2252 family)
MNFLTATVLSGVVWDLMKSGGSLVSIKLRVALKDWILNDNDCEKIVSKINDASEKFKKNKKKLEDFLNEDEEIQKILSNTKLNIDNQINIKNNTFNNSPQIITNNGVQNINYNNTNSDN